MKRVRYILIFLIFFQHSCRKDLPVFRWEDSPVKANIYFADCHDTYVPSEDSPLLQMYFDTADYNSPCFNPNNPDEFIYCRGIGGVRQLYKFNRATNAKQLLTTTNILSRPKWGKTGWILFSSNQIWKIKDTGDSLTQMTFLGGSYKPEWNSAGDEFTYSHFNGTPPAFQKIQHFYSGEEEIVTSLFPFSEGSWQNSNNLFVYFTTGNSYYPDRGFIVADMTTKEIKSFPLQDGYTGGSSPIWLNRHIFLFWSQSDIFLFDVDNGKFKKIGETCSNEFLTGGSYAPSTNELLCSISHWKYLNDDEVNISSRLIIINLNTGAIENLTP